MRSMTLGEIPALNYASTEAINTLATNLTFSGSQYKSIMLTSCISNEGKSFVAFNVVRALGNMGYTALLVDADLRKSVFASRYAMRIDEPKTGLAHYLAGHCQPNDILYKTNIPNMYVVPAGKDVANSLPLLASPSFMSLLESMKKNFDFVIVDAPPVGIVIDAAMIANACDATVFVINNAQITKRELSDSLAQIRKSGCTILGTVLNMVGLETHKSRKYYYKSYYSHYGSYGYRRDGADGKPDAARKLGDARAQHAAPEKPKPAPEAPRTPAVKSATPAKPQGTRPGA